MFEEYEDANPGVTIENKKAATSNDARDNLNTRLASGSGASDVEIDRDRLAPRAHAVPGQVRRPDGLGRSTDRWLDWKIAQATTPDGILIGYGTDIGPEAIATAPTCSRPPVCPTDRAEVAELLGGDDATWDNYFEVGKQYTAATGKPFFDCGRRHLPGHDQPGRERLRGRGRHDHRRRRTPR